MSERDFSEIAQEWTSKVDELSGKYTHNSSSDEYAVINYLFHKKCLLDDLESWLKYLKSKCYRKKSESLGEKWKVDGNIFFKIKKYNDAISCYNKCLENSPRNSVVFAYGLSNRASTYIEMEKFMNAVNDLELLFSLGTYPVEKLHKLYSKLAKCRVALEQLDSAKDAYVDAMKCSDILSEYSTLPNSDVLKETFSALKNIKIQSIEEQSSKVIKLDKENKLLLGGSNELLLKYSEQNGRHIISKTQIENDTLLFVEAPFAFSPIFNENDVSKVCNRCGFVSEHVYICEYCCDTHYCSEKCRIEAWDEFHRWECEGSKFSLWNIIGIGHLTLRVILIAYNNLFNLEKLKSETELKCSDILSYLSESENIDSKYSRVFHLVTNHDKISSNDCKNYAFTSIMISIYLTKYTDLFQNLQKELSFKISYEELRLFVSCLLYRHLLQMICNASLVTLKSPKSEESEMIGVGIYPTSSMMNHSCAPNTKNRYERNIFIASASKNIDSGSEVFNCYGPQYGKGSREERQEFLKQQYNFDCKCEACLNNL